MFLATFVHMDRKCKRGNIDNWRSQCSSFRTFMLDYILSSPNTDTDEMCL